MRCNTLFFLLVVSCFCLALSQVAYDDCCLRYVKSLGRNAHRHVLSYRHQKTDGSCNIPAVIFILRRGRKFCTNPGEKWVKDLIQRVDKRSKIDKFPQQHRLQARRG